MKMEPDMKKSRFTDVRELPGGALGMSFAHKPNFNRSNGVITQRG
jgi:hypothetical protein